MRRAAPVKGCLLATCMLVACNSLLGIEGEYRVADLSGGAKGAMDAGSGAGSAGIAGRDGAGGDPARGGAGGEEPLGGAGEPSLSGGGNSSGGNPAAGNPAGGAHSGGRAGTSDGGQAGEFSGGRSALNGGSSSTEPATRGGGGAAGSSGARGGAAGSGGNSGGSGGGQPVDCSALRARMATLLQEAKQCGAQGDSCFELLNDCGCLAGYVGDKMSEASLEYIQAVSTARSACKTSCGGCGTPKYPDKCGASGMCETQSGS